MTNDQFTQTADDYQAGSSDEVFIRTFKEAMTKIRIAPMTATNARGKEVTGSAAWPTAREHYKDDLGSFPCIEIDACVGCTDEYVNKSGGAVSARSRKYYFDALDEQGNMRVYKIGPKLYQILKGRDQRLGTLSDRDYIIHHMGSGLETSYDPEAGEKYDIDFVQADLHDIPSILTRRYQSVKDEYEGAIEEDTPDLPADNGHIPAKKAEPKKETGEWVTHDPTDVEIEAMDTGEIKTFLDAREVEYPSRAPRARLIEMAKLAAQPLF